MQSWTRTTAKQNCNHNHIYHKSTKLKTTTLHNNDSTNKKEGDIRAEIDGVEICQMGPIEKGNVPQFGD